MTVGLSGLPDKSPFCVFVCVARRSFYFNYFISSSYSVSTCDLSVSFLVRPDVHSLLGMI